MYFCDTNTKSKTKPFKHIPSCRQTKTLLSDTKPSTTVFATITASGHSTTWLMRAATRSTTRIGNECHPEENPKKTRRKRLAVKPLRLYRRGNRISARLPDVEKKQKTCFFWFMQISNLHFVSLSKKHHISLCYNVLQNILPVDEIAFA